MFKLFFASPFLLLVSQLILSQPASALPWNMHLIDSNPNTGFEIYRSSAPNADDAKQWCAMGIQEVYILCVD